MLTAPNAPPLFVLYETLWGKKDGWFYWEINPASFKLGSKQTKFKHIQQIIIVDEGQQKAITTIMTPF